ncbi:MAG: c-type cytochrome [Alphaproteobacteria bacterium]
MNGPPEAIAVAVSILLAASVALAEVPPKRQGELLYFLKHDCGSCHGLTRKGGLGSPLLPYVMAGRSDDDLTAIILDGVDGTPMPPWRALFSEPEARWMVGAIKQGRWQK